MVPSLLYNCPEKDVYSSELKYYEIMACEPLHDIKEHIDNIYREIPCHMNEAKNDIKRLLVCVLMVRKLKV